MSAVDDDCRAGHIGGGIRSQQEERSVKVLEFSVAPLRNAFFEIIGTRALKEQSTYVCEDIAGGESVNANARFGAFKCCLLYTSDAADE